MDTIRSTAPGMRIVAAALTATLAGCGLGLPASLAVADEGAAQGAAAPVVNQPATSSAVVSALTTDQIAADPAYAENNGTAQASVGVNVTVTNDAASGAALIDALNASAGTTYQRDASLEGAAYQRAAESTVLDANVRPDGTLFTTTGGLENSRVLAEILISGAPSTSLDANSALAALSSDQLALLTSGTYTNIGAAMVTDGNGVPHWAILLAADGADPGVPAEVASGAATYYVNVALPNIQPAGFTAALSVEAGSTVTAPVQGTTTGSMVYGSATANFANVLVSIPGGTWNTSNPSVATVDASGIVTGVAAGTCTVSMTNALSDAYNNTQPYTYDVTVSGGDAAGAEDVSSCVVAGIVGSYVFEGTPVTPAFTLINSSNETVDPSQYSWTYANNDAPGEGVLTITANPDSTQIFGSTERTFQIVAPDNGQLPVPIDGDTAPDEQPEATDTPAETDQPDAEQPADDANDQDAAAQPAPDNGDEPSAEPTSNPIHAVEGDATAAATFEDSATSFPYTGEAIEPAVTVTLADGTPLENGTDYTVAYTNNVEPGVAQAIITGIGAYTGEQALSFDIVNDNATDIAQLCQIAEIAPQPFTGEPVQPAVALSGQELVPDVDYTVSYRNNEAPGTATVVVTGIGAYSGTLERDFFIQGDLGQAQITIPENHTYTGAEVKPVPQVVFAGQTLTAGTDYTVEYANNINAGTATLTIVGNGTSYISGQEIPFTIDPQNISSFQVNPIAATPFTGAAITPQITVTNGTTALVAGKDYEVTYDQNVNAGTAHLWVNGTGNYTGSLEAIFRIDAVPMNRATITMPNQLYTGQPITPKPVSVTLNDYQLVEGVDYDVVGYANNTNVGEAKITLQGKGNFTGSVVASWKIVQQGTTDAGTTQTLPKTGDSTSIVPIVVGAVVGVALIGAAVALIVSRTKRKH